MRQTTRKSGSQSGNLYETTHFTAPLITSHIVAGTHQFNFCEYRYRKAH